MITEPEPWLRAGSGEQRGCGFVLSRDVETTTRSTTSIEAGEIIRYEITLFLGVPVMSPARCGSCWYGCVGWRPCHVTYDCYGSIMIMTL